MADALSTRWTPEAFADYAHVFYACVEGASDAIMLTDVEGTIRYVNRAWERIYGYDKSEALGATPRLLRSGVHDADFYRSLWAEILDPNKGYWRGEVINRAKDGHQVPVQLTINPFRDEAGVIRGYLSIAIDIGEKKEMEAQLLRQDRLASIGLLASGLAHEIGTPMGVIRGRAEFLQRDAPAGTDLQKGLGVIVSQIDRISKLIHSLLHLARTGPSDSVTSVGVKPILDQVVELVRKKLSDNAIQVDVQVAEDVRVLAEPTRLEQVLLNLIINSIQAIEAVPANHRLGGHRVELRAALRGKRWEISIRDTGCGISRSNMSHLFKPFFTTKDVGVGTGLGLAITHQILQAWGGAIEVQSEEGKGALFKLLIPKG